MYCPSSSENQRGKTSQKSAAPGEDTRLTVNKKRDGDTRGQMFWLIVDKWPKETLLILLTYPCIILVFVTF